MNKGITIFMSYSKTTTLVASLPTSSLISKFLYQGSNINVNMLWALSIWNSTTKEIKGCKTFKGFVAMQIHKISNFESKSPHYRNDLIVVGWLCCQPHSRMLMTMATCSATNRSQ
jgi:hypothetical protein